MTSSTPADPSHLDPEILECLQNVVDPEVGLSIVDLGLIYRAQRSPQDLDVAITLTTRACPLGDLIASEARERLMTRFPECRVTVSLVWDPPWTPRLMTERALRQLGRPQRTMA